MALLEAVPNFSTADPVVVKALTAALLPEVKLLAVDSGKGAGRTVITLAGAGPALVETLFSMIKVAKKKINMSHYSGVHPAIGACDVCPLVPLSSDGMAEAQMEAEKLARRLGEELQIPIYLYEKSARQKERQNLENIRRGGYSHLAEKLASPEWQPDYGPAIFCPEYGATVLGARKPLIAYNVNLATKEVAIAKKIAQIVRTSGTGQRGGLLAAVKAIGWYIAEYDKVQVSMNITDFKKTSIKEAFCTVKKIAAEMGTKVTGSELIGLAPKEALPLEWVDELGLSELYLFDYNKKIIENVLKVE